MDLTNYKRFVHGLLSDESKDFEEMMARLDLLQRENPDINVPALLTAADGLAAEGGEFMEIVKKIQWQGKPLNADNIFHMKRELGDALFYITTACIALGYDLQEIFDENVSKLEARYPGGFTVENSENRAVGDL